jgi:hypothetical protein
VDGLSQARHLPGPIRRLTRALLVERVADHAAIADAVIYVVAGTMSRRLLA